MQGTDLGNFVAEPLRSRSQWIVCEMGIALGRRGLCVPKKPAYNFQAQAA